MKHLSKSFTLTFLICMIISSCKKDLGQGDMLPRVNKIQWPIKETEPSSPTEQFNGYQKTRAVTDGRQKDPIANPVTRLKR